MIAVLMPYYNQDARVARLAADSVLNQGLHLVAYRDGGEPLTMFDGVPGVTHIGDGVNRGRGPAFNALLAHVCNREDIQWFTWMGSDDMLGPSFRREVEPYLVDGVQYAASTTMAMVKMAGTITPVARLIAMTRYLNGNGPVYRRLKRWASHPGGHQVGQVFRNIPVITGIKFPYTNRGSDTVWAYRVARALLEHGPCSGVTYDSSMEGAYVYFYGGSRDSIEKYRGIKSATEGLYDQEWVKRLRSMD